MRFLLPIFCLVLFTAPVQAKRVALVIGNDDYVHVSKLKKAVNDAKAVAATIRGIGFEVIESINADRRLFDQQLNVLHSRIEAGDEVLFFFAGHGISVRGRNYLLPIDIPEIKPGQERSVTKEAFSEDEIINLLQERGAKVSLLIIDACRNNPFPKKGTRSLGRSVGLGERSTPPRNTFVMYSAGFGQEALDDLGEKDPNPNSVFTRKLIPLLKTPGLSHIQMAKRLQLEVEQLALSTPYKHQQFPAFYDQVRGDFFLVPGKQGEGTTNTRPIDNADDVLWKSIQTSKKVSDFEFYLSKFPNGKYAAVAELKVKQFQDQQQPKEQKLALAPIPKLGKGDPDAPQNECDALAADPFDTNKKADGIEDFDLEPLAEKAIAACRSALKNHPSTQRFAYQLARSLYSAEKYDEAFPLFRDLSDKEHFGAMSYLGSLYQHADGVQLDIDRANSLYQQSADGGHARGFERLVYVYLRGIGVRASRPKAIEFMRKAAELGELDSMEGIADFYQEGLFGVEKNSEKATELRGRYINKLTENAGKGLAGSTRLLARQYLQGEGVSKDKKRALDLYEQAWQKGDSYAYVELSNAYQKGEFLEKNLLKARTLLEKAAARGSTQAMIELGSIYHDGELVRRDLRLAERWYKKAIKAGDRNAYQALALHYYHQKRYGDALPWAKKGVELGQKYAAKITGDIYYDGLHGHKNRALAFDYWRKGLLFGSVESRTSLVMLAGNKYIKVKYRDYDAAANAALDQFALGALDWKLLVGIVGTGQFNSGAVRALQQKLSALGYYNGTIDGRVGAGTRRALEAYDRDH